VKFLLSLFLAILLIGCDNAPDQPKTSEKFAVKIDGYTQHSVNSVVLYCFKGFVYARFSTGKDVWGSIMYDRATKQPMTCDLRTEKNG
jgi:predicted membrane chloride channel (bestrophin family)